MSANRSATLDDAEIAALVALVRAIAEVDDLVTLEESEAISAIAEWVGEERFWNALEMSRTEAQDVSDVGSFADAIGEGARRSVLMMLRLLAASDGITARETDALDQIRERWGLPKRGC